jgi:hypothetical protein
MITLSAFKQLPLKTLCVTLVASFVLVGCGAGSNKRENSSLSSSSSVSSSSSSVPAIDTSLSYGFATGIEPWYIYDSEPGTTVSTDIMLEHDAVNRALKITPLDWTNNAATNWVYQARYVFDEPTSLANSKIEYVVSIPQSYIDDGNLQFQFIVHGPNPSYGNGLNITALPEPDANGDYTIGRDINVPDATGFGFQLARAPTDTEIKDPILIKSVYIDRPDDVGGSSSSASSVPSGEVYTLDMTTGWSNDGSPVTISYDNGVVVTPDWNTTAQYGHTVMFVLPEPRDLTGATVTYEIEVPEAYIENGGEAGGVILQQFVQQNSGSYAGDWSQDTPGAWVKNDAQVVGKNTIVYGPLTAPPADIQRIGVKMIDTDGRAASAVGSFIIRSVKITFPGSGTPVDTSLIPVTDFDKDVVGTAYGITGWGGADDITTSVVTISSVEGLPFNGVSNNVLKIRPSNYNAAPVFEVTLPEGKTLADYNVVFDAYFPRSTLGLTNAGENYFKEFFFLAGTDISSGANSTNPAYQSMQNTGAEDVDAWRTFIFEPDAAKAAGITGSFQIAIGLNRPGNATLDTSYYYDNVRLEAK